MTESIINDWKKGKFKPLYWLEGEEDFVIDEVMRYAEHHILSEQEAEFNLTVFYGRDAQWSEVVNACRRYPMFAERQVVLLREAQQMRDVEKLEVYIDQPLSSTIFVVSYKGKPIDKRTNFSKKVVKQAVVITTKKMYENKLPDWVLAHVQSKGNTISQQAVVLLVQHIGNDLSRIANELEKIQVNLHGRKNITEDDIEHFVGVSKEYNVFELQKALGQKDLPGAIRILNYFEANPKAAPIQQVLPLLYSYFSKLYMLHGIDARDERSAATTVGVHPFVLKEYIAAVRKYDQASIEKVLLLLHHYNLKGVGIGDSGTSHASLMKELAVKMMHV